MSEFDCNKLLPKELVVESIDDFLYEIGLCHQSVSERTKRPKINSPKLIFTVLSFSLILSILTSFIEDETTLLLLMDIGHFEGIKFFMNMEIITFSSMALFNQIVYYLNYKRAIEPTFLRLFQVLSGSLSPSAVGLTDESQCRSLLKIAKWLTPLHYNSMIFTPLFCLLYLLRVYLAKYGFIETLFSMEHIALLFVVYFIYSCVFNIINTLLLYFIIVCEYFLIKLNNLNSDMKTNITSKTINSRRIRNILHSYDVLYREINEYNTTYWSQFLFSVWLFFGVFLVFGMFLFLFTEIIIISRILIFTVIIIMTILYIIIMTMASSVNLEANKSYKIFNSFIVNYPRNSKLSNRLIMKINLKVNIKLANVNFKKEISKIYRL